MATAIALCLLAGIFYAQNVFGTIEKGDSKAKGPKVTEKVLYYHSTLYMLSNELYRFTST